MPGTVRDVSATLVASTTRRPRCGLKHPVLLRGRQTGVQGQDFRAVAVRTGQGVGGIADVTLTAEEDEDVAGTLGAQLVDRVADRLGLVPAQILVVVDDRFVADLHRVGPA